jgi:hypothetical protein
MVLGDNNMFSSFIYMYWDYVIGQLEYNDNFIASGQLVVNYIIGKKMLKIISHFVVI